MEYRKLTTEEISQLQNNGCNAENWDDVMVTNSFCSAQIRNVVFTGKVYIGEGATLRNICSIGTNGITSFGNGVQLDVMKEDGGLEVTIHDGLTAMEAAFEVQEKGNEPELVATLHEKAKAYAKSQECDGCVIGNHAVVADVRVLKDVHVADNANVVGASRLENCSIASCSHIGDGVIMENCIVASGSHVSDGAQLDNCFVGQGCHIGRMYSATQSLFFANCHFENGEACAYFAGPYSVSHHKATLMIACQTSFFNAGSGSNQSNHSYKMGPNKYGQLLRGAKLGSSSYVYWPMQIGVFSTVIGHHVGHQDLRTLPFSLVTEGKDGNTVIVPGQAFKSVGTRRDAQKWPKRDKRLEGAANRMDVINFDMLNPYSVRYIVQGINVLKGMQKMGVTTYKGCVISEKHIEQGLAIYQMAIDMYLAQKLDANMPSTGDAGTGEWTDYAGMLAPKTELYAALRDGKTFADIADMIPQYEQNWIAAHFDISQRDALIEKGYAAMEEWNTLLDADGERDIEACNIEL